MIPKKWFLVSVVDTDMSGYCSAQHQKRTCSSEKGEIFKDIPTICGFADDICIVRYEGSSHDQRTTLRQVMEMCRRENLKLNKDKCHFRCMRFPFFSEKLYPEMGCSQTLWKCTYLQKWSPPNEKDFQ